MQAEVLAGRRTVAKVLGLMLVAQVLAIGAIGAAGPPARTAILHADEPQDMARVGTSLDAYGTTIVAGAPAHNGVGSTSGAAYVFELGTQGWAQQAVLTPSDAAAGKAFGASVAVHGDTVVVGAYGDGSAASFAGAVYVFTRSEGEWSQRAKLTASDAQANDLLGTRVAYDGARIVAGGPGADRGGSNRGVAFVFEGSGASWTEEAKLTPSDPSNGAAFGTGLDIDGSTLAVGAPNAAGGVSFDGAVYVFTRSGSTWSQQAKVVAVAGTYDQKFGDSVALEGDRMLVGLPRTDWELEDDGAAMLYERSGNAWSYSDFFHAPVRQQDARFGSHVDLRGDEVLIGAPNEVYKGSAYLFTRGDLQWDDGVQLSPPEADANSFGAQVAFAGGRYIVADPQDRTEEFNGGAVHVFEPAGAAASGATQDDGGSGGDASNDPQDPTPLPRGTHLSFVGSLLPGLDDIDAYGTHILPDETEELAFEVKPPAWMDVEIQLISPSGTTYSANAKGFGGTEELSVGSAGSYLEAGTWVLVIVTTLTPGLSYDGEGDEDAKDYEGRRRCKPKC